MYKPKIHSWLKKSVRINAKLIDFLVWIFKTFETFFKANITLNLFCYKPIQHGKSLRSLEARFRAVWIKVKLSPAAEFQ